MKHELLATAEVTAEALRLFAEKYGHTITRFREEHGVPDGNIVIETEHKARRGFGAEAYVCLQKWPFKCFVQCGGDGLVFEDDDKGDLQDIKKTAFFEAFPRDPDTFIRGEGATIEEAEEKAFAKLIKYQACTGHEFERRKYTNGAGFCKHCGLFKSGAFEPLPEDKTKPKGTLAKLLGALAEDKEVHAEVAAQ